MSADVKVRAVSDGMVSFETNLIGGLHGEADGWRGRSLVSTDAPPWIPGPTPRRSRVGGRDGPDSANVPGSRGDDARYELWMRDQRQVRRLHVGDVGARPLSHEFLQRRRDDVVFGADDVPGRDCLPGQRSGLF